MRTADLPRHSAASFRLFQHMGSLVGRSGTLVSARVPDYLGHAAAGRQPLIGRGRPDGF
jgi:hypothetical protein